MRILFSFTGGSGHLLPMLPVARVLAGRGHRLLFGCQPAMLGSVRALGFDAVDTGGNTLAAGTARYPLVKFDRAAELRVLRDGFAGRIARQRMPEILAAGEAFEPDVLVRDEVDFGAAVVAERLGVPHAAVIVLAAGGMLTPELLDDPLAARCAELGVPFRPGLLDRFRTLAPVMPGYRRPASEVELAIRPDVLDTRQSSDDPATDRVERWLGRRPARPLVYFTLGTVFHQESGDLFPRVLAGLERLNANIVVTVGRELDPAEAGAGSANVLVERFVPQRALLPRAAVVVSHAGSGTVVSALACGVPLVLLPLGADQPWNADRCQALGVGRVLDALTVTSDQAAEATEEVLTDPGYRAAAGRLRAEAESLPSAEVAADAIEQLAG